MNKSFKRLAAVVSLSLIISTIAVPTAVVCMSTPDVAAATENSSSVTEASDSSFITKPYTNDLELSNKQNEKTFERAQSFDNAKETAADIATQIDEKPLDALTQDTEFLLEISNPDYSYEGQAISLTSYDRDILERLVMGEAGAEGFIGCCLVAQAIRDTMVNDGYTSVESVRTSCGYYGSLSITPNQNALDAVEFIFDMGGAAVQHDILYFYAPALCTSGFHESQEFVVQYNNQRFFDRW